MEQASKTSAPMRNRIIPIITVSILIALLALLAYALNKPPTSNLGAGGRVNTNGTLIGFKDRQAPNFTLTTFDGETLSLEQFRGKTVILNFWGSWCEPCHDEAPHLVRYAAGLDPNSTVIIGIDIWDIDANARRFAEQYQLNYPNGIDKDSSISIDYGVVGVPETFFIGPDGALLGKFTGPVQSPEQIDEHLAQLSHGQASSS